MIRQLSSLIATLLLLTACGGGGGNGSGNASPIANISGPETVPEATSFTLDASGSTDNASTLTYSWIQTGGEPVQLDDISAAELTVTAPEISEDLSLSFQVTVTDAEGLTDTESITVLVLDTFRFQALLGPIVGADVELTENLDGDQLYSTQTLDSDNLDIAGTFQIPKRLIEPESTYTITVSGGRDIDADDDGVVDSESTRFAGRLRAIFSSGDLDPSMNRANALSELAFRDIQTRGLVGTADELDEVAQRILRRDLNGDGLIDRRDLLAFDPATDSDSFYLGAEAMTQLNRNVLDGENAVPILVLPTTDFTVQEEQIFTIDASESYDIDSLSLSFTWTQIAGPSALLFASGSPVLTLQAPNVSGEKLITLRLVVSDGDGGLAESDLLVTVTGVNDPPVLSVPNLLESPENQQTVDSLQVVDPEGGVVEVVLSGGQDIGLFSLDGRGGLQFIEAPDYENPFDANNDNRYELRFMASDLEGLSSELAITVMVTDVTQLSTNVAFPIPATNFGGTEEIHVSGYLTDEEDGEVLFSDLTSLRVNEQEANLSLDNPRIWEAIIPTESLLSVPLDIAMEDMSGGLVESALDVRNFTMKRPRYILRHDNEVFILDEELPGLRAVDLVGGKSRLVSTFVARRYGFSGLALDEEGKRLLVSTYIPDAIFAVDIVTGDTSLLSGAGVGNGPEFGHVSGVAFDDDRQRVLVSDSALDSIFEVDSITGDRTILFEVVDKPYVLTLDRTNSRILTIGRETILAIDLVTGSQHVIGSTAGWAPDAMVLDEGNNRLMTTRGNALVAINLANGASSLISARARGDGPLFSETWGITSALESGSFLVSDQFYGLFEVNGETGDREILVNPRAGDGLWVHYANDVAFDNIRDRLVVSGVYEFHFNFSENPVQVDLKTGFRERFGSAIVEPLVSYDDGFLSVAWNDHAVVSVGSEGGDRTVISDEDTGTGPAFNFPYDLALDRQRHRVIVTNKLSGELLAVDLASGDRSLISGESRGIGVNFQAPEFVAVDLATDVAYVTDQNLSDVMRVNLATGNRIQMCRQPGDVRTVRPAGVALDAVNDRILVVDAAADSIIAIDRLNGHCTTFSNTGSGPAFRGPKGLSVDSETHRAFVAQNGFIDSVIQIDLVSGQRAVVSN